MDTTTKHTLLVLGIIALTIVVYLRSNRCECEARISYEDINLNEDIDLDQLFQSAGTTELNSVRQTWQDTDLRSDSFRVVNEFRFAGGRDVQVIGQYYGGAKHYGAIILPAAYDRHKSYPLIVWANGLDQSNPSVNLYHSVIKKIILGLPDHFVLIPAYRGQTLVLQQDRYCSDGFFGDAYDGAATDALRLLELTQQTYASVNQDKISVCGLSRGGTVALLMATRDSTLRSVVSIAGPTDFFSREVYYRYHQQYKYQFLSRETDIQKIRKKMIACSPIYFIHDFPNDILVLQGRNDTVVPLSNATKVAEQLEGRANFELILNDGGHSFYDWDPVIDWIADKSKS